MVDKWRHSGCQDAEGYGIWASQLAIWKDFRGIVGGIISRTKPLLQHLDTL